MTKLTIAPLKDYQEHIPAIAKIWYEGISKHWVPDSSAEKAEQKLLAHLNTNKLPIAYIALYDDKPVGVACLRETDGIQPGITPWLGSLAVDPNYQRLNIGESLINHVKLNAKSLGHDILYLLAFDPTIPRWYARLGWQSIGEDKLLGHRVEVMKISL